MSSNVPIDESLLEHTAWTRSLAARLVPDPERADELSQDTLVMALERPPRRGGDLRRWLGTVMGNLLRQGRRREARLREREKRKSRPEAQPDVLETLERAESHRELVDVLLQVEEPFRTALVLRFFEGLPPREVARRLDVPINTVRSRVRRGLEHMRVRLDRRHRGDRRAWVGTLVSMVAQGGPGSGILTGGLLMSLKTKLVVAAVAILAGVLWTQWPALTRAGEALPPPESPPEGIAVNAPEEAEGVTEALVRSSVDRVVPVAAESGFVRMRGKVVGVDAGPLPGVRVAFHAERGGSDSIGAVSEPDGGFAISVPFESGTVLVDEPGFVTLLAGKYRPDGRIEPVVVAAPSRGLNALVLDEEGRPLAGARSQIHLAESFAIRFTQVLESSQLRPVHSISDEEGRIAIVQVPVIDGVELLTSLRGFRTDRRALSPGDDHLRIVLQDETVTGRVLEGVVLDSYGAAAAGAYVALDGLTTRTEDDGTFRFDLTEAPDATRLRAVFRDSLPAELSRGPDQPWPDFVTLRLGGSTEIIAGTVVDLSGNPQEGVVVWVSNPTLFGTVDSDPVQVENLLAGSKTREELESYVESQPPGFDRAAFLESTPTRFWTYAETDARGRFILEGLLPKSYRLSVLRRETLEMMETGPVEAGSRDVRIEFGGSDVHENVTGRVIDREGRPLAGVLVSYSRTVFSVDDPDGPPGRTLAAYDMGIDPIRTDEQGKFRVPFVPVGLELLFYGDLIIPTRLEIEEGIGELEVVVPSRVHFRVELSTPELADAFAIMDADGQAVGLQLIRVGRRSVTMRGNLTDGRSQILATEDGPFTLVLYRGGREVERHPVYLRPGDTNVLR